MCLQQRNSKQYQNEADAYKEYEQYMAQRDKQKDPFWTFSGWLAHNGHTIVQP